MHLEPIEKRENINRSITEREVLIDVIVLMFGNINNRAKNLNEFTPFAVPGNKRSTTVTLASVLSLTHCAQHNLPDVDDSLG